jgi:hypothetical protein
MFLLPENYRDRASYHPVDYMQRKLEKESNAFNYLGGYKKPDTKINTDRHVSISQYIKQPFKNSSISQKIGNDGIFKTELSRMSTYETPRLDSGRVRNELDKCKC